MALINKAVRGLGKITGTTIKVVKDAPKKTVEKSKDLKDAFVDGLNADKADKTPNVPEI
jgi:hypothetical protein